MTRIIAGSHGGRRLATPPGARTRPTTDRVREAVFSALESWAGDGLGGLAFLDLYAGSGAMALEAASRGASPVTAVESDRRTADVVRRNAADLGLRVEVRTQPVEEVLSVSPPRAYDIIWADPPYPVPTDQLQRLLGGVWASGWLAADGLLVLERSSRDPDPQWPDGIEEWSRRYGETTIHYAQEAR
ncbi:16S rRNA (guanine(966)-N(2))-methyltransferase RsmD [Raineyella fluvialis]|uniref:16S rRNA (Guanine(966)-N(2))-methyltransferase RsmD n=1 Tax=Raineyella fluvialis TaxID=2662261 RepID=A0A5Q2FDS0_9ACTN|nr:16S rRNA (guanine(966)-N(2))-methyltransferase RsmD [Raineyella fluvialis]QGF24918.1 16S rRNA (guanine(966)-N(2))-methyltransferase RsmD [Raineyella fluvialis]